MNFECSKCTALHFQAEKVKNKSITSFNDCCKHGKVILNDYPILPDLLLNLFKRFDPRSNNFLSLFDQ